MIKHITYGTDEVFHFNYNGEKLPLRPISSYELDQCFFNALKGATKEIAEIFLKLKMGLVKGSQKITYNNKLLAELRDYFDNLDYWVVYYGMKDFQEDSFSIEDVKKMQHIHQIALRIYGYSYQPKEIIEEIVRDGEGRHIATIVFNLNIPLGKLSELTKLQRDFLIISKLDRQKPKKSGLSKSGDTIKLGDILGDLVNERSNRRTVNSGKD
jgi:hypothetical protein